MLFVHRVVAGGGAARVGSGSLASHRRRRYGHGQVAPARTARRRRGCARRDFAGMVAIPARRRLIPAILATGTDRGPSQGLAAAVAVEAAALTGAGVLLVEVGEGVRHRGPTLLASAGAREVEEALRSSGRRAAARGHVCHLALEDAEPVEEVAESVAKSGAELAVIHLPGRLWVPALEADGLAVTGGCLLVSLPD